MRERVKAGSQFGFETNSTALAVLLALLCCPPAKAACEPDFSYIKLGNNQIASGSAIHKPASDKTILDEISKYFNYPNESSKEVLPDTVPVHDIFTPIPDGAEFNTGTLTPSLPEEAPPDTDTDIYAAEVKEEEEPVILKGKPINEIKIEGLEHIPSETVLAYIKNKNGSLYSEELLQQDLERVYSSGFFTDNIAINPVLNENGSVDLIFELHENLMVNDIEIWGNTVLNTEELMPFTNSLKGMPQNLNNINKSIEGITDYYHQNGYILAGVKSVDDEEGILKFYISEGVINQIILEGNKKTKDYVITRNILSQPGTVYNELYFKDDLARIYDTKLFKEADREIIPVENGEKGEYDIKVVVKEASSNNIAIGGGVDNALGIFGSLSINDNNFLGKGQRVSLSGLVGSGILLSDSSITDRANYQVELSFFEPYFLNADNSLMSKLYYRDLGSYQVPLAIERRFGIMANLEHKIRNYEGLTSNLGIGIENISLKEGDFNKISAMYANNNLNIANRAKELTGGLFFNISPALKYKSVDTDENPRNGIVANVRFNEALGMSDIKHTNGRLIAGVTKYFPVAKKSSLAITGRAGVKVHGDEMPEIMAFGLGGPYSIRGFRMNGVGMGDGFIMGSAELAVPLPWIDKLKYDFFKKIRLTFFVDAGQVYDKTISSVLYDRPLSAISAGVGLKVYIPNVGPVSVDYGIPITNPGAFGSKSGYFTFGTGCLDMYNY